MIDKSPEISSFIIRFIHTGEASSSTDGNETYRGTIRHILSNKEIQFTSWKEAISFIGTYVPIEEDPSREPTQDSSGDDKLLSS
jgi:hypothetical protein